MRTVALLILFIGSIYCNGQSLQELHPRLGKNIDLSPRGEKEYINQKSVDDADYWEIFGNSCSFYCASALGVQKATSELKPEHGISYRASYAHDLSYKTAWIEGVPGYGIGESIAYTLPPENPRITKVIVINGYVKSDEAWKENSRVKKLKMYVNGKPYAMLNLEDSKKEQIFNVETIGHGDRKNIEALKKKPESSIKFEIADVYPGEKYEDTAITEIYFDGIDHH